MWVLWHEETLHNHTWREVRSESFQLTFTKDKNGSNLCLFPFVLSAKHEKSLFFSKESLLSHGVFGHRKCSGPTLNAVGGVWSHGPAWDSPTDPGYQRVWRGASVRVSSPRYPRAPAVRRSDQLARHLSLLSGLPPVYVFITFRFMTDFFVLFCF